MFSEGCLLLQHTNERYSIPLMPFPAPAGSLELSPLNNLECKALTLPHNAPIPTNLTPIPLRTAYYLLSPAHYQTAIKATELLHWNANTCFCPRCGTPLHSTTPISKHCPQCHIDYWPQFAVAALVLIRNNDQILLVRPHNLNGRYYALVAGFVETGENLEQCLRREVMEETNLRITNLHYYGSQAWPYPLNLLTAFYANYDGGTLRLQPSEIADGGWFPLNHLPPLPDNASISRRLIDACVQGKLD